MLDHIRSHWVRSQWIIIR